MTTPTVVTLGLAGGQGKTTVALMLGRCLGRWGIPVLFIDADPQSSLTSFLGVLVEKDTPTLLEVITQNEDQTPILDTIMPVPDVESDSLIARPVTGFALKHDWLNFWWSARIQLTLVMPCDCFQHWQERQSRKQYQNNSWIANREPSKCFSTELKCYGLRMARSVMK